MADLRTFVRRIRARGRQVDEEVNRTVVQAAQVVNQAVILATPVDTGRARANWIASVGVPVTTPTDDADPEGGDRIAQNAVTIAGRRNDQTIFISNNVDYIGFLNQGSSSQAPANFVEIAVQQGLSFLRRKRILR